VGVLVGILALALLALVVFFVTAPLRARANADAGEPVRDAGETEGDAGETALLQDLEAAREAKYREIRDAELDYRTGKLSTADYGAINSELRAEALAILDRIERAGGVSGPPTDAPAAGRPAAGAQRGGAHEDGHAAGSEGDRES
jgi:hypothetical protein